jgi:hypothetical protein
MGSRSTLHPRVAKQQLNQHLGDILTPMSEEVKDSFEIHLPRFTGQSFQPDLLFVYDRFLM